MRLRSAAALAVLTLAPLSLASCTSGDTDTASEDTSQHGGDHAGHDGDGTGDGAGAGATTTPEPTTDPSSEASASGQAGVDPDAEDVTVPAYFVGTTPQGPRLFREFRQVPAADPLTEAAVLATSGQALDPDYATLFPSGSLTSVTFDGDRFVVTLPDATWTERGDLPKGRARLAVQQLVYTLQGVQQTRAPVVAELEGAAVPLLGIATADGIAQADPVTTLSQVMVNDPAEGAEVSGTFTATGAADSFEANVPWALLDADGAEVLTGFATAEGWGGRLYPWSTVVDVSTLPPGTYTFRASTDDASGGEGGGPTVDTRTVVVD